MAPKGKTTSCKHVNLAHLTKFWNLHYIFLIWNKSQKIVIRYYLKGDLKLTLDIVVTKGHIELAFCQNEFDNNCVVFLIIFCEKYLNLKNLKV